MKRLEELSLNAHPALQTELYDGWIIRFANGYTGRANSVSALYSSTISLDEKIDECERRYARKGLPCKFKIVEGLSPELDAHLEKRGYEIITPTDVMTLALKDKVNSKGEIIITPNADEEWFNSYIAFEEMNDTNNIMTAREIFSNVKETAIYCRILDNDETVAVASAVIECGYMLLHNVVVKPGVRGKGYGRLLCMSILDAAMDKGAKTSYLQVVQTNEAAMNLYKGLGYKKLYTYWYRSKNML